MYQNPIRKNLSNVSPSVRHLRVQGNTTDFERITSLEKLEKLEVLSLSRGNTVQLSSVTGLKFLMLRWGGFTDLSFLRGLKDLPELLIWQTPRLQTLDGIEGLENLHSLTLFEASKTARFLSLEPLRALKNLTYLHLRGPMSVESLAPLASLPKLSKLDLFTTKVQDGLLAPLKEIPNLQELDMWVFEKRFDLEQLALAASLAPNLLEKWLDFQQVGDACKTCGTEKYYLIGRGTRSICPQCHPQRAEEFANNFRTMVEQHRRG